MSFLAPKLLLTPLLIASASLAGRRWGAATTGWLVALPLTSGPILLFIALEMGPDAVVAAAGGSLLGALGQVAFATAYATAARSRAWPVSLVAATGAFAAVTALSPIDDPIALYVVSLVAIAGAARWLRSGRTDDALPVAPPGRWDIPARAVVATALVVAISAAAPLVGGRAAGILATFPVYASVLTTFAHRLAGPAEAKQVLLGLVVGLAGFASFFLVVAALSASAGIWASFGLALAVAVAINVALLAALRRLGT